MTARSPNEKIAAKERAIATEATTVWDGMLVLGVDYIDIEINAYINHTDTGYFLVMTLTDTCGDEYGAKEYAARSSDYILQDTPVDVPLREFLMPVKNTIEFILERKGIYDEDYT